MADYIDRQAAIDALGERPMVWTSDDDYSLGERNQYDIDRLAIETVPSADVQPVRHGKWEERKVADKNCIDEWQTACCSVCHKYHTTPYMYYFDNYNYCPNCGARMDGDQDG